MYDRELKLQSSLYFCKFSEFGKRSTLQSYITLQVRPVTLISCFINLLYHIFTTKLNIYLFNLQHAKEAFYVTFALIVYIPKHIIFNVTYNSAQSMSYILSSDQHIYKKDRKYIALSLICFHQIYWRRLSHLSLHSTLSPFYSTNTG